MTHYRKAFLSTMASLLLAAPFTVAHGQQATIRVDAGKVEQKVTPYLYGSCIEDVNHEIYGGLYDQKIFGESFEEPTPGPDFKHFNMYEGEWSANGNEQARCYKWRRV